MFPNLPAIHLSTTVPWASEVEEAAPWRRSCGIGALCLWQRATKHHNWVQNGRGRGKREKGNAFSDWLRSTHRKTGENLSLAGRRVPIIGILHSEFVAKAGEAWIIMPKNFRETELLHWHWVGFGFRNWPASHLFGPQNPRKLLLKYSCVCRQLCPIVPNANAQKLGKFKGNCALFVLLRHALSQHSKKY